MSTSILISGEARTFKYCYENQREYVYRQVPDPHFYVSVANDAQAADMERLREHYESVHIENVLQPSLPEPKPSGYAVAGYAPSSPPQAILRQFWFLKRVWGFAHEAPGRPIHPDDLVIRLRPDLFFRKAELPLSPPVLPRVPYWGGYGGVNDRFAVMNYASAEHYFKAYDLVPSLLAQGCPLHPERLLSKVATFRRTLNAEFCTVRMPDKKGEMAMIEPDHRPGDLIDYLSDR